MTKTAKSKLKQPPSALQLPLYYDNTTGTTITSQQTLNVINPSGSTSTISNLPSFPILGLSKKDLYLHNKSSGLNTTSASVKHVYVGNSSSKFCVLVGKDRGPRGTKHSREKAEVSMGSILEMLAFDGFYNDDGSCPEITIKAKDMPSGPCIIDLNDDSKLYIDHKGDWKFVPTNQKKVYKSALRDFNEYVNASDLLEEFITYTGSLGLAANDFLNLPIELFICWLIIRASEEDGETPDETEIEKIEVHAKAIKKPRCRYCKKFLSNKHVELGIGFCNDDHLKKYMEKHGL